MDGGSTLFEIKSPHMWSSNIQSMYIHKHIILLLTTNYKIHAKEHILATSLIRGINRSTNQSLPPRSHIIASLPSSHHFASAIPHLSSSEITPLLPSTKQQWQHPWPPRRRRSRCRWRSPRRRRSPRQRRSGRIADGVDDSGDGGALAIEGTVWIFLKTHFIYLLLLSNSVEEDKLQIRSWCIFHLLLLCYKLFTIHSNIREIT